MIILEMIMGYFSAKKIAESQTTQFFLTYEKHNTHENLKNIKSTGSMKEMILI